MNQYDEIAGLSWHLVSGCCKKQLALFEDRLVSFGNVAIVYANVLLTES